MFIRTGAEDAPFSMGCVANASLSKTVHPVSITLTILIKSAVSAIPPWQDASPAILWIPASNA